MLTGEYAVLDGRSPWPCLPKRAKMTVKAHRGTDLVWQSYDHEGKVWFESEISIYDFSAVKTTDQAVSDKLKKYLKNAVRLNCEFLDKWNAYKIETFLEFPRDWGLGSSSTPDPPDCGWAEIMPLELYLKCENGSGYDVACAGAKGPIEFINSPEEVSYTPVDFKPSFADQLFLCTWARNRAAMMASRPISKRLKTKNLVKTISDITENAGGQGPQRFQKIDGRTRIGHC